MSDLTARAAHARLTRRQLTGGAVGLGAAAMVAGFPSFNLRHALAQASGGTIKLPLGPSANVDLNPIGIRTLGAFYLQSCMYDGLVLSSPSWDDIEAGLAETWDVSEDGLTYTFHLRQGVKWHDGEPFSAADVIFTYKTILTQAIGSYMASTLFSVAGAQDFFNGTADDISGLQAPDDKTVVFTLISPNASFLFSILTQHSIIPEHVWKDVPAEEMTKPATWETGQIGTGPFKFVEYKPDQYLKLEPNPDAWRGAPLLDGVLFVVAGTTPEAQAAALEKGDLDYSSVPPAEYDRLSANESLTMYSKPVYNIRFLSVNVSKPYLADVRVRQAIACGIDRKGIVEAIIGYMGHPIDALTPSAKWKNDNIATYPYDPERAKSLLAEAGWDPAQKVVLSLYYQDQANRDAVAMMQQNLLDIGMAAEVLQLDGSAVQSYYYDNAEFDIMLAGLGLSPDMDELSRMFMSDSFWPAGQNAMHYTNPKLDELFIAGREAVDDAARKAAYDEVQVILADELPWIPVYNLHIVAGMNKRIVNGEAIVNVWNRPYQWNIEKVSTTDGK